MTEVVAGDSGPGKGHAKDRDRGIIYKATVRIQLEVTGTLLSIAL